MTPQPIRLSTAIIFCTMIFYAIHSHSITPKYRNNKQSLNHRSLLSDDKHERILETEMETEPQDAAEEDLCIVCYSQLKNDDSLYIAWTDEEWKEMSANGINLHFPDCHGSELCSGCLIKVVCSKSECPKCKRKPQYPPPIESQQSEQSEQSQSGQTSSAETTRSRPGSKGYSRIATAAASTSSSSFSPASSVGTISGSSSRSGSSHRTYTHRGVSQSTNQRTRSRARSGSRPRQSRPPVMLRFLSCLKRHRQDVRNMNGNSTSYTSNRLSYLLPCIFGSSAQ